MSPTPTATVRDLRPRQLNLALVILGLLLAGVAGCAPAGQAASTLPAAPSTTAQPSEPTAVPPTATSEATVPSGWETYTNPRFQYSISDPPGMEGTASGDYSWMLGMKLANPDDGTRNFMYVSVIPEGFQNNPGDIYNYDKSEANILLNLQVGESKSLREGVTLEGFTYTRKTDTTLTGQAAKTYENTQPFEFPDGTKEIRYYLPAEAYTYLIGGYIDTTGSNQPGAITEEFFNQIVATLRVMQ